MASENDVLELGPGEGRAYSLGRMKAVFKADHDESAERYAISEWWLEPHCTGPGAHLHETNEEIFYVLEGTASFLVGEEWRSLSKGSFLRIPAGIMHDFENRGDAPVGLLNVFMPGGFEQAMPSIVQWFAENPQGKPSL
ncbi:MAG: cupin domain-containing protein [Hoeflea sp.]|uniref:cupin domain-containing protein n=1 Tax=Hoeflea sp. TaxID=1940281 RepID=UPI001DE8B711|nr:cupin domain-containing protein [Hoeflea sp.]MBU4529404.1 cupin domain-containing protein [Alphaproteobacteria bacterium]MBU4546523.1 cupin domain-containing protein [Alphaproteobacteria bacterium]MBU4550791.1 cupin domain-containing protein [Alphaproteobacteria bacterium]MBV1723733.1 cupin domain-containing protein [Hoeflea sp.]MBV1763010.1 cupin domain-containing protein [Hoeflea sp.]